jgi:hypothetical protein
VIGRKSQNRATKSTENLTGAQREKTKFGPGTYVNGENKVGRRSDEQAVVVLVAGYPHQLNLLRQAGARLPGVPQVEVSAKDGHLSNTPPSFFLFY